jgi:hypothetical protein
VTGIASNGKSLHSGDALIPCKLSISVPISRVANWIAQMIAKAIAGMIANGIIALARTVVVSDIGSDFQNRMLRSRRSE